MPTPAFPVGQHSVSSHLERLGAQLCSRARPLPGVQGAGRRSWLGLQVTLRQLRELLQSPPPRVGPCHLPACHLHYRQKRHGPRKPWCAHECTRAGLLGGDGQLEGRVSASQGATATRSTGPSVPCW